MSELEVSAIKALEHTKSEGNLNAAIKKADDELGLKSKRNDLSEFPTPENFKRALLKAGATPEKVAKEITRLMLKSKKTTYHKDGSSDSEPDNQTRLKALEVWLKYFAPTQGTNQNHLHLHGEKKLDELLSKTRGS